jgi:hypothetical protein
MMFRVVWRALAAYHQLYELCAEGNPPISVTKLNQFPKARKRVFPAFARRRTGHSGITQQRGVRSLRAGPRPRPEATYLGRRGAAALASGVFVTAANREESLEKISTRGGVRPVEVVSGDMMARRSWRGGRRRDRGILLGTDAVPALSEIWAAETFRGVRRTPRCLIAG